MAQVLFVRVFRMKKTTPLSGFIDAVQRAGSGVVGLLTEKDVVALADDKLNLDGSLIGFEPKTKIEFEDIGLMTGAQLREYALPFAPPGSDTKTELFESDLAVYGIAIYLAKEARPKLSSGPTTAGTQSPAIHTKQTTPNDCPECGQRMAIRIISGSIRKVGVRPGRLRDAG